MNSPSPLPTRLLIVDDDPDILEFLEYNLRKEGYTVETAPNGKAALAQIERFEPQLILVDVMMPEMDGIKFCQTVRGMDKFNDVFIVFLTARIEEYSEIAAFSAGADDYITKPIKPGALLSRLKAIIKRRSAGEPQNSPLNFGELVISPQSYEVSYQGQKIHFARKEFELLLLLASHPGQVYTREKILETIWGNDVYIGDRTIDVHIRKIREKTNPASIKTIKGVGYKFEA